MLRAHAELQTPNREIEDQSPRVIAFHLPQFHPIPENDVWWGPGFTEWSNVARGRPLFSGHYQPRLPADLGFYDLRLAEARARQAELARDYGVHGFCYYHYWFAGKRLLERPAEDVLASGEPDFPFCLCWANENWTRRWDGLEQEVLIEQDYSDADDEAHFRHLCRFFRDPRYIRVNGRPLFLLYRASALPNPPRTLDIWRRVAEAEGVGEMFLCRVEKSKQDRGDPRGDGFDAGVEFHPRLDELRIPAVRSSLAWKVSRRLGLTNRAFRDHWVLRYPDVVEAFRDDPPTDYPRFECVFPGWDNSVRRKKGAVVMIDESPPVYGDWLADRLNRARPIDGEPGFVFVDAWNEWAEGAHLEPCSRWGRAYLEATHRAVQQTRVR